MNPISISIQYAGMTLQVVKNDAGEDVTPLKPFADLGQPLEAEPQQNLPGV